MTKQELQKELLEKVKPGTKPSDIKKSKDNISKKPDKINKSPSPISINEEKDEGYESDSSNKSVPTPPISPNQNLLDQITSLKKQLQTYKDFKEADLKIKEKYKQEIKELKEKNQEQYKTIEELKSEGESKEKIKELNDLFTCLTCNKSFNIKLLRLV